MEEHGEGSGSCPRLEPHASRLQVR